jgi:hypothetical protein
MKKFKIHILLVELEEFKMKNINMVKELEQILQQFNFMGTRDKTGVNLAVNQILNRIEELGFEIVEKETT